MKKNIILVTVLAAVTSLVLYFYLNKKDKTITDVDAQFAIENVESIDRIFIVDTEGNKIDLRKNGAEWLVNDSSIARQDAVKLLLRVFKDIKIQSTVDKEKQKFTLKRLASVHRKVEIYQGGDEPVKVWYIGDPTSSNFGTNMLLEVDGQKSNNVYITELPWHHGFITPMFFTELKEWKETKIFSYELPKVKKVSLVNHVNTKESFTIEVSDGNFIVKDNNKTLLPSVDSIMVKDYLRELKYKAYETVDSYLTAPQKDSLLKSTPLYTFNLTDITGKQTEVIVYKKSQTRKAVDEIGNELAIQPEFDQARSYALINKKELVLIQMQSFGKLLVDKTIFEK